MKVSFKQPRLHVSELSGKLEGIAAISGSALDCEFCTDQVSRPPQDGHPSICRSCYARAALEGFRRSMRPALVTNTRLLEEDLLQGELPYVTDVRALRFNSHGELTGPRMMNNFVRIAELNKHLPSALWTKRLNVVDMWREDYRKEYLGGEEYPDLRMCLIASSPYVGLRMEAPPEWVDRVYTVYESESEIPSDAYVCRGHCAECMLCYTHRRRADGTDQGPLHVACALRPQKEVPA